MLWLTVQAQTGFLSGTIDDGNGPMPGVNITIKGQNQGTQSDFDGNYRLKCEVGDILIISYLGLKTREVKVTSTMFGEEVSSTMVKQIAVEYILDSTYQASVRKSLPTFLLVPSIKESPKTYNYRSYLRIDRIKSIAKDENKVKLTYFDPDIYFEVGASSRLGIQFVRKNNLPETQNTFAQGIPFNGANTYLGPETNTIFSYGPKLNTLSFDGSNYPYDTNGELVSLNTSTSKPIAYNNNLFKNIFRTSNTVFFNIATDDQFYGFDYLNSSSKDSYDVERSSYNEYNLRFNNTTNDVVEWKALLGYVSSNENQPNINGFHNNLLLNALATPPSFSNSQGLELSQGIPRDFSSSRFNNPYWLLQRNRNQIQTNVLVGVLQNTFRVSDDVNLKNKFSYTLNDNNQAFGFYRNTVGFIDGYSSDKSILEDTFNANVTVEWNHYHLDFDLVSTFFYSNENLKYNLTENFDFADGAFNTPQASGLVTRDLSRSSYRWFSRLNMKFFDSKANVSLVNNSFASTKQNSIWLLPTIQVKYNFVRDLGSSFLKKLSLSASLGYDVNYVDLFYKNQSHNSLNLTPEQSMSYTANSDLFVSDSINLEEKRSYEIGLDVDFRLFDKYWSFSTNYFSNTIDGSVFPVFENNEYQLQNIAKIQNYGSEWTLDFGGYNYSGFRISPKLIFTTYETKVLDIFSSENRIPIAGFSTISKNLIEGEPAGVLVGTAYARDTKNNIIIDANGFPIVDSNLKRIGDPTPDFNLGFSTSLHWKSFKLDFVLDYQKGGDVWNGTQQVLNYLGASQESAVARETTGFVYQGVNQQGDVNTIPVDFANPQNGIESNRFVRYGFEGIVEEAIVDGSYFNFKSINLTYDFKSENDAPFFREIKIGVYGNNLFTASKFKGATPYSSLFDQASSQGLQFFNNPLISEVGMKINIKI